MHLIDLTSADSQPLEVAERICPDADGCGEDVVRVGEFMVDGQLERVSRGYQLTGRLKGAAVLRCARCLVEFSVSLDESFEIELRPATEAPHEDETRLGRNELDVIFYETPLLDLATVAAEQVQLAVPMKPLCSEGCRGFCSRCGRSLNEGPCECPPEIDARWTPLEQWRGEQ